MSFHSSSDRQVYLDVPLLDAVALDGLRGRRRGGRGAAPGERQRLQVAHGAARRRARRAALVARVSLQILAIIFNLNFGLLQIISIIIISLKTFSKASELCFQKVFKLNKKFN